MLLKVELCLQDLRTLSIEDLLEYFYRTRAPEAAELLIEYFLPRVQKEMKAFYCLKANQDDFAQEGLIGLHAAIEKYDGSGLKSFIKFSDMCIRASMVNLARHLKRKKHILLSEAESLEELYRSDPRIFEIEAAMDPIDVILRKEMKEMTHQAFFQQLSELERDVLFYYKHQLSYKEISHQVLISIKSVDNTIQRIRKKYKNFLELYEI